MATTPPPDLYEILGVSPEADLADIKAAYRKLSRLAHPDVGGSAALFGMIQHAYETLRDPKTRAVYDLERVTGTSGPTPRREQAPSAPPGMNPSALAAELARQRAAQALAEAAWREEVAAVERAARRGFGDNAAAWALLDQLIATGMNPKAAVRVARLLRRKVIATAVCAALLYTLPRLAGVTVVLGDDPSSPVTAVRSAFASGGAAIGAAAVAAAALCGWKWFPQAGVAYRSLRRATPRARAAVFGAAAGICVAGEHLGAPTGWVVVAIGTAAGFAVGTFRR